MTQEDAVKKIVNDLTEMLRQLPLEEDEVHAIACFILKREKALRDALDKYGNHLTWCSIENNPDRTCKCGFKQALKGGGE